MAKTGSNMEGDGDDDFPSAEECARRCKEFVELTNTDSALAQSYLQDRQWIVETSVAAYYEDLESSNSAKSCSVISRKRTPVTIDLDLVPDTLTCTKLCEKFAAVTGTNTEIALSILTANNWDLEKSVQEFLDPSQPAPQSKASSSHSTTSLSLAHTGESSNKRSNSVTIENLSKKSCTESSVSLAIQPSNGLAKMNFNGHIEICVDSKSDQNLGIGSSNESDDRSDIFKLISWNIDGLDRQNIKGRAAAVAAEITQEQPDVVFLQEVIDENLQVLREKIGSRYQILTGGDVDYFTAILLKKSTIRMENQVVISFPGTRMGRNLISILATWNKIPLTLMTAHLESCKESTDERQNQLRICFQHMLSQGTERVVVFGGDLNLRDPELKAVKGIPATVIDLWSECGARPECKATWDAKRNTNTAELCQDFGFKPQCRFDRLYFRPSSDKPCPLKPSFFGLVGITKVPNSQRYPSDHWGIMTKFDRQNEVL